MELGKKQVLTVVKQVDFGVYLGSEKEKVLRPKKQVPDGIEPGDPVEVFLYKDSSDRLIATTNEPKLMLGGLVDVGYGDGGEPAVTFRGADGKPLQGGKEDFIKYLYGSADFQPLLTGVQSSGGGAAGGVGHGGAVDLSKMTMTERAQLANTNPALFDQLSKR